MFRKVALAMLFAGTASAASAADMPVKARPFLNPEPVVNWSGLYVGGFIGGAWGETDSIFILGSGSTITSKPSGFVGGFHAGYDWQLPNRFVVGVNVSFPVLTSVDDTTRDAAGNTLKGEFNWAVLGTGYIGYSIGRWLPYAGLGFGVGEAKGTFTSGITTASDTKTHTAFIAIAGIRYWLSERWWLGLQYTYGGWSSETYSYPVFAGQSRSVSFDSHMISGLASYRF